MNLPLDEVLHFDATTRNPLTGAIMDADSTPTWAAYEEDTDTAIQSGSMTKRTSLTGRYRGSVTCSAANGFEVGKWYSIQVAATVGAVADVIEVHKFRLVAAEGTVGRIEAVVPDTQKVDVNSVKTQTVTCGAGVTVGPYVGNASAALSVDANGRVDVAAVAGTAVELDTIFDTNVVTIDDASPDQAIRDAMKLAPTAGDPAAGSIDKHVDDILADTGELQTDWADGGRLDNILDGRLASASYTAPDNAGVADAKSAAEAVEAKLPSRSYLAGSAAATGETQTDATAALTAYDPPTNTEMEARTKLADEYADKTTLDTIAGDVANIDGEAMRGTNSAALAASWTADRAAKIDNLDNVSLGTGARTVTITVNDGTDPLENAKVRVTNGAETYSGTTSALGIVAFALDDATWTVAITKPLYTFTTTTLVVSDDTAQTYSMTAVSVSASDPGLVTGTLYCYDESGEVAADIEVSLRFDSISSDTGYAYDTAWRTETSDANGLVQFTNLIKGASYIGRRGIGEEKTLTIASDATSPVELDTVWGIDA